MVSMKKGRECGHTHGPSLLSKEETPLGDLFDPNPRIHGGCFGVLGHTSSEALWMEIQA
jgi:hypothetical protein